MHCEFWWLFVLSISEPSHHFIGFRSVKGQTLLGWGQLWNLATFYSSNGHTNKQEMDRAVRSDTNLETLSPPFGNHAFCGPFLLGCKMECYWCLGCIVDLKNLVLHEGRTICDCHIPTWHASSMMYLSSTYHAPIIFPRKSSLDVSTKDSCHHRHGIIYTQRKEGGSHKGMPCTQCARSANFRMPATT